MPHQYRRVCCVLSLMAAATVSITGCRTPSEGGLKFPQWFASRSAKPAVATPEPTPPLKTEQVADVQFALGRTMEQQGHLEPAIRAYEEVIKNDRRRADAHHRLAILYDKKGEPARAESYYRQALQREPNNPEILCDLGYSYYLQGRWAEAEAQLRRALAERRDFPRAHVNLGLVMARTGRHDVALASFGRAGCSEADAHVNLAYALMWDHHWEAAEQHLQRAAAVDPNSDAASKGLSRLRQFASKSGSATTSPPGASRPPMLPPSLPAGPQPPTDEALAGLAAAPPSSPARMSMAPASTPSGSESSARQEVTYLPAPPPWNHAPSWGGEELRIQEPQMAARPENPAPPQVESQASEVTRLHLSQSADPPSVAASQAKPAPVVKPVEYRAAQPTSSTLR